MSIPDGALVVLEGADGVGKSTLHAGLLRMLSAAGRDVLGLSFPGKEPGSLGRLVYDVHHDEALSLDPLALQTLHVAAHIDAIQGPIKSAMDAGQVVLLDRYWWSTWAYGTTAGIPVDIMEALIRVELHSWAGLKPSTVLLVHRAVPFRKEHKASYHHRLTEAYGKLAAGADYPVSMIDNDTGLPTVLQSAFEVVEAALERTNK